MGGYDTSGGAADVHLAGWTIVRLAGSGERTRAAELAGHVGPLLTAGAKVVVELADGHNDLADSVPTVRDLVDRASSAGATLAVVTADSEVRDLLRVAGLSDVYESLDAALHVQAPVLREAGSPAQPEPLAPGSDDALRPL